MTIPCLPRGHESSDGIILMSYQRVLALSLHQAMLILNETGKEITTRKFKREYLEYYLISVLFLTYVVFLETSTSKHCLAVQHRLVMIDRNH